MPWAGADSRVACADAAGAGADDKAPLGALFEDPEAAEEWDAKKQNILTRFTVQGNITVNATFDIVGRAKRGCAKQPHAPQGCPACRAAR